MTVAMMENKRGGMCENPFGGRPRLDRLDLMQYLEPNSPPEKIVFLATIQDAVHNYMFFALGRNGTTAEEFASASQYFFHVRSTKQETWEHSRMMRVTAFDENNKRRTVITRLSDIQLKNMCFDVHYDHGGLNRLLSLDRFLSFLKRERAKLLEENWAQVTAYLDRIRQREMQQIPEGNQIPLRVWAPDDQLTLTHPESPRQIAEMLYYSNTVKKLIPEPKRRVSIVQPRYAHLLQLGVFNHESVTDNSNCSAIGSTA